MAYIPWDLYDVVQEIKFYQSIGDNEEANYLMNLYKPGTFTGIIPGAPAAPEPTPTPTPTPAPEAEPKYKKFSNSAREGVLRQFTAAFGDSTNTDFSEAKEVLDSAAEIYGPEVYDVAKYYVENYERLTQPKNRGFGFKLLKGLSPERALTLAASFALPNAGAAIGEALGLSGQAATVAGGAALGAGISTAAGGDPVKGAIAGAIGSVGSTTYATDVGAALGATGAAAPVVGNAVINSALSGIAAAATGGNVEKSMLAGAVKGAAIAGATEFADAVLGKDNVASIAKAAGLEEKQIANIFTTSVANGVTAEITGQGEFLETVGISLAAQGVGAKSADLMKGAMKDVLDKDPEIMAGVLTATGGIATTAANAALRGEDVGKALENSAPGIILASVQAYQQEADRQDELAAQREKDLVAAQQQQDDIVNIIEEQLRTGGITDEGVQVAGADGVTGVITPPPDPLREIDLAEEALQNAQDAYAENPTAETLDFIERTRAELNRLYENVTGATTAFDLRQFTGDQGGEGRAIFGGGGYSPVSTAVGFNFIGTDFGGNQQYDVGGESFTLITLPNRQKVLLSDVRDVILYPQEDPQTKELTLTQAPATEVIPEEQLRPVELKPGTAAPEEEGVTGEAGTPAGLTAEQIQRRAEERDRLVTRIVQEELDRLDRELQQAEAQRMQTAQNLKRAQEQAQRLSRPEVYTGLGPDIREALEAELVDLEAAASEAERAREAAAAEREGIGAVQRGEDTFSDEELYSYLQTGELPPRGGEGETAPGTTGAGTGGALDEGTGPGAGETGAGPGAGEEGAGVGGGGTGGAGSGELTTRLSPSLIFDRETGGRPETTPFASRVTGEALASILGEKEPLFGGDEDEQRAVWNRRSLRLLSRALGL